VFGGVTFAADGIAEAKKERDDVVLRMDEMAVDLRKARMFAASQDYYIDRRLVANVLQVMYLAICLLVCRSS